MLWFSWTRAIHRKIQLDPKDTIWSTQASLCIWAISGTNQISNNPQLQETKASRVNYQSTHVFSSSEIGEVLKF